MSTASGAGVGIWAWASPKNLAWTGSLRLSLSFLIRRMCRTRPLQRFQVCAKAALLSAGTCAPSSVPFNTPVGSSGFLIPPQAAPQGRGRKEGIPDGAAPQLC